MKVRLETAKGEFVTDGDMPPFNELPEVVMWGVRLFKLVAVEARLLDEPAIYRECFAWYLV